jgi:hypothetical protein
VNEETEPSHIVRQMMAAITALPMSPVTRQVYLNRLVHTPTEAEIAYARQQITAKDRTKTNA